MPLHESLFQETFESMKSGDGLPILGGTFPGKNETAEVRIGLSHIVPVIYMITRDEQYAPHENPLFRPEATDFVAPLERNDKRFGHDYGDGPNISYGKRAGVVLGQMVDIILINPMTPDVRYMIAKPSQV